MADSGKQSPLGVNVIGSLIDNIGLYINPIAESYMGKCKVTDPTTGNPEDYQPGTLIEDTCLKWLTYAIHDAYQRGAASQDDPSSPTGSYTVDADTYNNLINIGKNNIPALGNSPPSTWKTTDPSGVWVNEHPTFYTTQQAGAPANSGYPFYNWDEPIYEGTPPTVAQRHELAYKNEGQLASWYPWFCTTSTGSVVPNRAITQWGWIRCIALQAWQEFNFNGSTAIGSPVYSNFCYSFTTCYGFLKYNNQAIIAINASKDFLKGAYSNMNDLISADLLGVCLASRDFGQDLINLGNAIDLSLIKTFGLPSTVLQILSKNNALTPSFVAALLTAGIPQTEIMDIASGAVTANKDQEQKIYSAMLIITGPDLEEILLTLNCSTKTLEFLADLTNIKKMFPSSYLALTVPIYNTQPGPTNSKTYYPIYVNGEMNPVLLSPPIQTIVGNITPASTPAEPAPEDAPVVTAPAAEVILSTASASNAAVNATSSAAANVNKNAKLPVNLNLLDLIKKRLGSSITASELAKITQVLQRNKNLTFDTNVNRSNSSVIFQINNILRNNRILNNRGNINIQNFITEELNRQKIKSLPSLPGSAPIPNAKGSLYLKK